MAQPLRPPLDLSPDLAEAWPERIDVELVNLEKLVDPESLFAADERKWAEGKMSVVAEARLFPDTPDQKTIRRRSRPAAQPTPALYRETINRLALDVRQALDDWRRNEAPETLGG